MTETYSGSIHEGWNLEASYDRIIFNNHSEILEERNIQQLINEAQEYLNFTERSRATLRCLVPCSSVDDLRRQFPAVEIAEIHHPLGFSYLTIGMNRSRRRLPFYILDSIHSRVMACKNNVPERLQLPQGSTLAHFYEIDANELVNLWGVFGWTLENCQSILADRGENMIFGLRNRMQELIAAVFLNNQTHRIQHAGSEISIRLFESTEWSTREDYRHHRLMGAFLHEVYQQKEVRRNIDMVWADIRTPDPLGDRPHSISPALQSGMVIEPNASILEHHVSVYGEANSYNATEHQFIAQTPIHQFRNFCFAGCSIS